MAISAIHDNFIGIYENAFSENYCKGVINSFELMASAGYCVTRQQHDMAEKVEKDDLATFAADLLETKLHSFAGEFTDIFMNVFWDYCYPEYSAEYGILKTGVAQHGIYNNKIQKTNPGQGYHIWHCEAGDRKTSERLLAYVLYLNDVEEGGETEFLYQHKRLKPKQGTLVIFPASFTHTHRGNPPLSGSKYILTGWVEF